ncbi:ATP-binding protein [Piscinibacter koreensis]|uniref:AAA family ATPase n=1 Tax=Piscinibacter koreensis TaxID=2742824 RepID=A0A7Y6NMF9_9BURK|nr:adenylate/guanylate cyclase domain-containing protein [Schlegelella koreensis]NUZ05896.1 AAA family ATPase [Schlegelella koreensis]
MQTASETRRCHVTLLFTDLSGSSSLGTTMEAELYADLLESMRARCRDIVRRHGGSVARVQGDGVLVIFGLPLPREDDGRRAVETALELHHSVEAITLPGLAYAGRTLRLHSGIHSGLALVRQGNAQSGAVEVLGDAPNTAANLCNTAAVGEILVTAETLGPHAHFFVTEPCRAIVKGRSTPLAAYRVLERRTLHRRFDAHAARGLAPFVGRESEQRQLVAEVLAKHEVPRCIAVVGEPGLGKTRLMEEVLRSVRGPNCLVLNGYCESYLSAEPLQPFMQILRAVVGMKPDLPASEATSAVENAFADQVSIDAPTREALLGLLALGGGEAGRTLRAGSAVAAFAALIQALAAGRRLVLALDDWQWADELSQRVLDAVLDMSRPVLVLLSSRSDGEGVLPRGASPMVLAPLSLEQTCRTVAHLLPQSDPFLAADIHRYAGGVPLFIEELCHSAAAQPLVLPAPNRLGSAWMAALVESRIERLPPDQRRIVSAAAVIGNVFPGWLLEKLTGHGEASPLVGALAGNDFIFHAGQAGMLRFKHGLTRDVVYQLVGLRERKALHLAAAEAIASRGIDNPHDEALEALAYHYAAADLPAEAARFAELAGDKAMATSALDRARAQYAAALDARDARGLTSREDRLAWCHAAEKLGMACVWDPLALAEGVAIFERSVALAREALEPRALARAEYWLSYIHYAKGNAPEALEHGNASLRLAREVDDAPLADQVQATLGQTLATAGRYDEALTLLGSALDSKRSRGRPGSNLAVGSAYALACKGSILGDRGDFDAAQEAFDEALSLVGNAEHQVGSSVRNWISAVYQWQGRWDDAERVAAASMHIAELCRSRQLLAMSRALWGFAQWRLHGDPVAVQTIAEATAWIEARKGALVTSLNYGWLVAVHARCGHEDEMRRHAARLLLRVRRHDRLGEAMGWRALARAAIRAGAFPRARQCMARAETCAALRGSAHEAARNQLARAELAAAGGDLAAVRQHLDVAQEAFERMRMRWHAARAEALRARTSA